MGKEKTEKNFGPTIRDWREKKEIGLRRFADMVGMSPTYLSKVERGDFPPPGEDFDLGRENAGVLSQSSQGHASERK